MAWQPKSGFRSGIDAVLLAAACPVRRGESVLELGCGAGVASLCVRARVPDCEIIGVELQEQYVTLARRNGLEVILADVAALPTELRQRQFHHVIMNPPYFTSGPASPDPGRDRARSEETPLVNWLAAAEGRLRAKGRLTLIQRADRLPDLLAGLGPTLGSVEVWPLQPRAGRASHLVLLTARKDGRAPFRLHAPLTLHAAARHEGDHPGYTPLIADVLQNGAALPFPD